MPARFKRPAPRTPERRHVRHLRQEFSHADIPAGGRRRLGFQEAHQRGGKFALMILD